jgi:hypothetical protein
MLTLHLLEAKQISPAVGATVSVKEALNTKTLSQWREKGALKAVSRTVVPLLARYTAPSVCRTLPNSLACSAEFDKPETATALFP